MLVEAFRDAHAGLRAVHFDPPSAHPCRSLLDARQELRALLRYRAAQQLSRSSDFSRATSSAWRLMRRPASRSSEVAGVAKPGSKLRWCTLMPMPDDGESQLPRFGLRLDQDAARLARADQQIVGPAQIDCESAASTGSPRLQQVPRPSGSSGQARRRQLRRAAARSRKAPARSGVPV